jgi:hypothetical protein
MPIASKPLETYYTFTIPLDHFNSTTCYYFPGSEAFSASPSSTIPLQQAHSTMVPNTMIILTRNMVTSQTPIGTPLLPSYIPSLPLGYNALNASIPNPTQVPSGISGAFIPPGHNLVPCFIPTLPQPPSGGSHPPLTNRSDPSDVTQSFTPNYQIPVGIQFNPGGQSQPPLEVKTQWGHNPQSEDNLHPPHPMDKTSHQH